MVKVAMYSFASQESSFGIGNITIIEPYCASYDLLRRTPSYVFDAALKSFEQSHGLY
jgi:hypothetical protein